MNTTPVHKRVLAWTLTLCMANPAFMNPAWSRDTDIYVNINTSSASPPNMLIMLDTSDSMNIPDDWREYPGAYDSHVEYLWNDTTIISAYPGTPTYAENASKIALGIFAPTSITASGTTATVTTSAAHGLSVGWSVTVSNASDGLYNGTFTIGSVPTTTTFTYTMTGTPAAAATATPMLASGKTVSSITRSGTTATATVTAHGFASGTVVLMENASDPLYNGSYVITSTGANTFTYVMSGTPAANAVALNPHVLTRNPTSFSKYGFWSGSNPAERYALWRSAYMSATTNEPGDTGPRSTYRNYNDAGWIYWLPAGTAETDKRLSSNSYSRWKGAFKEVGGRRGISTLWSNDNSTWYASASNTNLFNKCTPMFNALMPSTVFAPTNAPLNAGKYLNHKWLRWERWLGLTTLNLASYPGSKTSVTCAPGGTCTQGYVDAFRDNNDGTAPMGRYGNPVRIQNAGVGGSYAGWTGLIADMGGFNFWTAGPGSTSYNATAGNGSINETLSWYGITTPLAFGGSPSQNEIWRHTAWKGNLDASPTFGNAVGTSAYYDTSLNVTVTGAAAVTITKTRTCTRAGHTNDGPDAIAVTRQYGGACTSVADADCNDQAGSCRCSSTDAVACASVANPAACSLTTQDQYYTRDNDSCAWSGRTTTPTANYSGCAWTGRQNIYIEGYGNVYYGGTCKGTCTGTSCPAPVGGGTNYCNKTTSGTLTVSSVSYVDYRTDNATNGCSNLASGTVYYCGGTCQGRYRVPPGTPWVTSQTSACNETASGSITLGATTCNDYLVGGSPAANASAGCATLGDNITNCNTRNGGGCVYSLCNNPTSSASVGGSSTVVTAYNRANSDNYLYHDCQDAHTASPFMRAHASGDGNFGTAWSTGTAAANSYTTASASGVNWGSVPATDMYSVNYLNWKFGPKGPNGHPIGRKTRLQIAKDALSQVIGIVNRMRIGLEVFNKMDTSLSAEGGNIAKKVLSMGPRNCSIASVTGDMTVASKQVTLSQDPGLLPDDTVTIAGAGAAGADLTAKVIQTPSKDLLLTVDTEALTAVTGATVTVPACLGSATDVYSTTKADAYKVADFNSAIHNSEWAQYNNRAGLINAVNAVVAASRTPLTESLYEAYLYYNGKAPQYGTLGATASVGGTVSAGYDASAICSSTTVNCPVGAGKYESPMLTSIDATTGQPSRCQKNHVIVVTDGGPEDDFAANALIKAAPNYTDPATGFIVHPMTTHDSVQVDTSTSQFESSPGVPYGPTDLAGTGVDGGYIWMDELAYYMSKGDMMTLVRTTGSGATEQALDGRQGVTTHTIGFAGANTSILKNTAAVAGGTNTEANSATELYNALLSTLTGIELFSPQGSSASVPISALNRTENGDDVYLAFFSPDGTQAWNGTVKKYKLGAGETLCGLAEDASVIQLCLIGQTDLAGTVRNIEYTETDPTGNKKIVVNPNAVSFWADIKDGASGQSGGSGYQLVETDAPNSDDLKPHNRKIYTFITDPGSASEAISSQSNLAHSTNAAKETNPLLSKTRLGNAGMTDAARATLINYVRGGDPTDSACSDNNSGTPCATFRKAGTMDWAHADVVHSKPTLLTYDSTSTPIKQYVFYLSSDGLLHAITGYPDEPASGGGKELWSFLVEEALPKLQGLKDDTAGSHVEVADGSPVIYFDDANHDGIVNGTDKVYLFFGQRRGGPSYYALDVTDISTPKVMWKIVGGKGVAGAGKRCVGTTCTVAPEFDELGDTWSTPAVGRIRARTGPVIIFGGGYDVNQDQPASFSATADTMGRAVYVIEADTSALVKAFKNGEAQLVGGGAISGMDYSIPSEVAALNTDLDGQNFLDRLYVGDTGANLWRMDINNTDEAQWTAKLVARLSGVAMASPMPEDSGTFTRVPGTQRKIIFAPVVAKLDFLNSGQRVDGVYVLTGDRENPTYAHSDDGMFMIKDYDVGLAATAGSPTTVADLINIYNFTAGIGTVSGTEKSALIAAKGWYLPLKDGEKGVSSPSVFGGTLQFSTYTPNESVDNCSPAGKGVLYGMDYQTGGLPPMLPGMTTTPTSRLYSGFAVRGYIPTGSVLIRDKAIYVVHVAEGRLQYQKIGTIGGATKVYWYREQSR